MSVSTLTPVHNERNNEIVELLEDALESAKKGNITNVVVCATLVGHAQNTGWVCDDVLLIAGMLERAKLSLFNSTVTLPNQGF